MVTTKAKAAHSTRWFHPSVSYTPPPSSPESFPGNRHGIRREGLKNGRITVCLFGDGALEEGAAPEALNLASLWKLPVLFLCENNGKYGAGRATSAAQSSTMAAFPLTDLPKAYKVPAQQIDGLGFGYGACHDFRSCRKDSPGRRTTIYRSADRPLARQRNQLAELFCRTLDSSLAWNVSGVPEKVREWYRSCDPLLIFIRELVDAKQATQGRNRRHREESEAGDR